VDRSIEIACHSSHPEAKAASAGGRLNGNGPAGPARLRGGRRFKVHQAWPLGLANAVP